MFKNKFSYQALIKYLSLFLVFLIFNCLENQVYPYSTGILVYCVFSKFNIFASIILYLLSFVTLNEMGLLLSGCVVCIFFLLIKLFYIKCKHYSEFLFSAYTALSMIGFIFLGSTTSFITYEKRILVTLISTLIALLSIVAGRAITQKGLKFKYSFDESLSIVVMLSVLGLGVSNLISPLVWKGFSAFIILLACYFFNFSISSVVCCCLGLSFCLYYSNVNYVSIFLIIGLISQVIMPISRYFSALCIILTDCLANLIFGLYPTYLLIDLLPLTIGCGIFCILPTKFIKNVKEKISEFKDKQLVRQTINRNRLMLSNRLYELAYVFTEISATFTQLKENDLSEKDAKAIISNQIISNLCSACPSKTTCSLTKKIKQDGIVKMIEIGFAKGKLSLIDMPKSLADGCTKATDVIYYSNRLLSDYRSYCVDRKNMLSGRELLSKEAEGIAQILKGLALEEGTQLNFKRKTELLISDNLLKNGFLVTEVLVFGNNSNLSISLIICMKEYSIDRIQRIISSSISTPMELCEKINISEEKTYLTFNKSCTYDAVFGVSKITKDNSVKSGDTHSVIRIKEDKFLVALSDGMGSGERAEKVSSSALSLIESFYKAGIDSNLILNTVNKLLSINSDDTFTALDIAVVDLNTCKADFIKYGSPYGFIIGEKGIKIIEGQSLPLGILQELKPSVCTSSILNENMILLISDGVSDSFGESSAIIEYLQSVPALNPQSLTDNILKKALELSDGKANDDMTALAVRIFKK